MMGNTRADLCSRILKREVGDQWLKDNCDPASTIVYLGIDWTEDHRFDDGSGHGAKHRYARSGWTCEAPMTEKPLVDKNQMKEMLKAEGINLPRLYTMNFAHNNCGGFCIKAGQGHFANLYRHLPQPDMPNMNTRSKSFVPTSTANTQSFVIAVAASPHRLPCVIYASDFRMPGRSICLTSAAAAAL